NWPIWSRKSLTKRSLRAFSLEYDIGSPLNDRPSHPSRMVSAITSAMISSETASALSSPVSSAARCVSTFLLRARLYWRLPARATSTRAPLPSVNQVPQFSSVSSVAYCEKMSSMVFLGGEGESGCRAVVAASAAGSGADAVDRDSLLIGGSTRGRVQHRLEVHREHVVLVEAARCDLGRGVLDAREDEDVAVAVDVEDRDRERRGDARDHLVVHDRVGEVDLQLARHLQGARGDARVAEDANRLLAAQRVVDRELARLDVGRRVDGLP